MKCGRKASTWLMQGNVFFTLWLRTPVSLALLLSRENSSPHPCARGVKECSSRWMGLSTHVDSCRQNTKYKIWKTSAEVTARYRFDMHYVQSVLLLDHRVLFSRGAFGIDTYNDAVAKKPPKHHLVTLCQRGLYFYPGEKIVRSSYPEMGYEMGIKFEKQSDMIPHIMDHNISNAVTYLGSESLRPLLHHPGPPISLAEVVPIVNPMYHHVLPLGQRTEHARNCDSLPPHPAQSLDFPSHTTSNGPTALSRQGKPHQSGLAESPSNSGADSADSARSSPQERQGFHRSNVHPGLRPQAGPVVVGPSEPAGAMPRVVAGMGPGLMRVTAERPVSHDGVRVFGRDGQEVRAFQCEHCRVLFLDHVMYTIHMGCHGYREPLECNICGHRSKDRYEFSSHIVRGEHTFHWAHTWASTRRIRRDMSNSLISTVVFRPPRLYGQSAAYTSVAQSKTSF